MQVSLAARRDELGALLRAAYAIGDDAPLKLMLSQDKVAEAARALAYHRYLQRDRMQRIATLSAGLAELERVEREITQRQAALDAAKAIGSASCRARVCQYGSSSVVAIS